ncbi:MAG: dienelactone hydrolase family protein [Candidatus Micrarchaeota archaeon]|nr:dienelactone hydrolase family protein [Candidatus Micrarchaeota archaeon]
MIEQAHETIEVGDRKIEVEYSREKQTRSVVLSHGMYNNMHTSLIEKLFHKLSGDYNVARFNFSFSGKPESADSKQSIRELEAVISFLGDKQVALVGKSFGGYISSLVAAKGKLNILKVIALGYSLHEEGNTSVVFDLDNVGGMKVPLVIIKGDKDPYCDEHLLKNQLPNCKLHIISDADHSFKPLSDKGSKEANEEKVISLVLKELEK